MTFAPKALLDVRTYVKPLVGLPDVELGIVGDDAHDGGYHHGWDQRRVVDGVLRDYSWQESPRDWNHKSNAARAFDLGWFDRIIHGRRITLIDFNLWVVAECQAGAPDTLDLREVIYTPGGKVVKRWDRLGKRSTGDPSHLRHTHMDWFADAEHRDKTSLFRRFFEGIGDDMAINEKDFQALIWRQHAETYDLPFIKGGPMAGERNEAHFARKRIEAKLDAIGTASPEVAAILAGVDGKLAAYAERVEAEIRDAVADLGEGGAAQVRQDA